MPKTIRQARSPALAVLRGLAVRPRYGPGRREVRRTFSVLSSHKLANDARELGSRSSALNSRNARRTEVFLEMLAQYLGRQSVHGPFVVVAPASTSREAPDVSRVHTPFDVDVIETPSELQYNPTRDGEHVLFLGDSDVELLIYQGDVALAARRFPVEGCALVADGILVDFEAGESYRFLVPSRAGARFLLFVEHLGTFGDDAWETSCE